MRAAFDGGRLTSDAGVLVLAEIKRRLAISERLARCLVDPRSPGRVHYTMVERPRARGEDVARLSPLGFEHINMLGR